MNKTTFSGEIKLMSAITDGRKSLLDCEICGVQEFYPCDHKAIPDEYITETIIDNE